MTRYTKIAASGAAALLLLSACGNRNEPAPQPVVQQPAPTGYSGPYKM